MGSKDITVMLPVHRSNLVLANSCIKHILDNSDYNIVLIDDFGSDYEYLYSRRISFIHNQIPYRQPLSVIWNQCINECPTDNVIIHSWRQRLSQEQFQMIPEKLAEGYATVSFDGIHVFGFHKFLMSKIGLFDTGFKYGQYEDIDWWYRFKYYDLGMYCDDNIEEERVVNGRYVDSMWLDPSETNKKYFYTKWTELESENKILLHKLEENFEEREKFLSYDNGIKYKTWDESVFSPDLIKRFESLKTVESRLI
jgi:hypothetical protein